MTSPITPEQIHEFAATWFRALDVHAPIDECWSMLTDDKLNMHFPDGDIHDFATFSRWYNRVTNLFFDERHAIRNIEVHNSADDQADVTVVVEWKASWWLAPAAQSERVDLEVTQRWTVRRCSSTKNAVGLEIVSYILADDLKFAPGSAKLPEAPAGNAGELVKLNQRVAEMEQQAGAEAVEFFNTLLSDKLIFRRASGKVVGKSGPEGFLEGLKNNPFKSHVTQNISINLLEDRALVTLVVVANRNDDGSVHRYRNIRLFSRIGDQWILELWYNYEITSLSA